VWTPFLAVSFVVPPIGLLPPPLLQLRHPDAADWTAAKEGDFWYFVAFFGCELGGGKIYKIMIGGEELGFQDTNGERGVEAIEAINQPTL
jgi:hypothetical protein